MHIVIRQTKYLLLLPLVLLVSVLLLPFEQVGAVESYGIGAMPAHPRADNPRTTSIFVYESEPGSVTEDAVKLINNTDEQRTVKVYAVDSQHSSDGAFACAQAVDEKKDVGAWLTLQTNEVTLEPNSNKEVSFSVKVPATAETGEHNGCIAIEDTKAPTQQVGNGIVLSFRSALRVAVTVPGNIEANLAFTNLIINEQKDKLMISPILKNTGNVSVDASVKISLNTFFGGRVASSEGTFVVLNKNESRFNFELEKPFWGGWYTLSTNADYALLQQAPSGEDDRQAADGSSRMLFIAPQPAATLLYSLAALAALGTGIYLVWRRRQFALMHQATGAYTVKPGDNLQALAERASVNWRKLAKLNNLKPPYSLRSGQVIRVPKPRPSKDKISKKQD